MYRVLLVDDEKIFLCHLRSAGFWRGQNCEICGEAVDGESAVEAVRSLRPDIVFMDINLPGLNGMDASEKILKLPEPPHIIVLTAHGEFSFAHRAIKLGVFDYLLKPFDSGELAGAVQKCIADIELQRSNHTLRQTSETGEIERYLLDLLELGEAGSPSWRTLQGKAAYLAVIVQVREISHDDLPIIREAVRDMVGGAGVSSYIAGIYGGAVVVIHALEQDSDLARLQSAYDLMTERGGRKYTCVALGDTVTCLDDIPKSYRQALTALENRSRTGKPVVSYRDVEALSCDWGSFTTQDLNLLIKLFETGQYRQADEVIERIFSLSEGQMISFQYMASVYHSLLLSIYARYQFRDAKAWDSGSFKAMISDLNTCVTTREIIDTLVNSIHEAFSDCMNLPTSSKSETLVRKIEKYLDLHYNQENLTVDQIAQALFFENSYIRRVFKTQTGKTIVQRLEEIRMEHAKELLEQTALTNSEIAARVGYSDPFYFSRRFKLYSGFSPTDYRGRFGRK